MTDTEMADAAPPSTSGFAALGLRAELLATIEGLGY